MNLASRRVVIRCFDVVESTNDTILEAGARGEPEGTTHLAREQTRGRGRARHRWWSPRNRGLWMSALLRPSTERARWSGISLVAGAAVLDVLRAIGVSSASLYWPNDLQVGRRKIGGILCEVRATGEDGWIALGVGLNLDLREDRGDAPPLPADLRGRITSLAEASPFTTREPLALASEILERFFPLYDRFLGGESVRQLVGDRLAHRGGRIRVAKDGGVAIDGTIEGLSEEGRLCVRLVESASGEQGPTNRRLPAGVLRTSRRGLVEILSGDVEYVE